LLAIGRFSLYSEWNVLVGESCQSSLGHDMLTGSGHATRKATEQKGKGALLGFAIRERDGNYLLNTSEN